MLSETERNRLAEIEGRMHTYKENVGNYADWAILKKTSIRRQWEGDVEFLLALVKRLAGEAGGA
jgi:poly(3-hydroxybutyrate) depolymerase